MERFVCLVDEYEGDTQSLTKNKIYTVFNGILVDNNGRWWNKKNRNFEERFCSIVEFRDIKLKEILYSNL